MTLAGADILWLGWNGFNGGDPIFANAIAAVRADGAWVPIAAE